MRKTLLITALLTAFALCTSAKEIRTREYRAYRPLRELARELKVSEYDHYENPTGIYVAKPGKLTVTVKNMQGMTSRELALIVRSFDYGDEWEERYPLHKGKNVLEVDHAGLTYVDYRTPDYKTAKPVQISIKGGEYNGFFDKAKDSDEDWTALLKNAKSQFVDLVGDYVHLTYKVSILEKTCPEKGWELIDAYDQLIGLQYDLMGLVKYDRVPVNHMFARHVAGGYFADGYGAAFDNGSIADPATAKTEDVWGIAHEFGHVNQIRPGLKWVSTTELTNNVYSICSRYVYFPEYMNLEMERLPDCEGHNICGGRYSSFLNFAIRDKAHWLTQRGPDDQRIYEPGMSRDHFVKLIPIWQMLLYYRYMDTAPWYKPDWYADIAETVRTWPREMDRAPHGVLNCEFMKNAMKYTGQDLSDFFEAIGMLAPLDEEAMNDYSCAPFKIDAQMIADVKAFGAQFPKPATPVLYYLSYYSKEAFEKMLPVEGEYGKGAEFDGKETVKVDHDVWKNVAVFEAYEGDTLRYISMKCLGNEGRKDLERRYTYAIYPEGCTRLEAVGADGKRTLVYGTR